MISGLDLNAVEKYVIDEDKENPTIWHLGLVPSSLYGRIHQGSDNVEIAYKYLQLALKGWENFSVPFETTKEKVFGVEREVVPMQLLDQIDFSTISKLYLKALELRKLTEIERKN